MKMLLLLLSLLLSITNAQPLTDCNSDSCRRYPEYLPSESRFTSEENVLTTLLCYFDCLENGSNRDNECQDECVAIAGPPPFLIPTLTAPTLEPIVLQLNEEGLYGITLPNVTIDRESGSGSDVTLIGSGSNDVIAYTVRINQLGNDTYVYFPMTSQSIEINLAQFGCSDINLSYDIVLPDGLISDYSPSSTTCVFTPEVDAVLTAENLVVRFEEDIHFPQQAILHISWETPSDTSRLEGYVLNVDRVPPPNDKDEDEECANQDPMSYDINPGMVNFTIEPVLGVSRLNTPLYTCTYNIELISLPGDDGISQQVLIEHKSQNRQEINPLCTAEYFPSLINYNLTISWTIEDPLAREAVKDSVYRMEIIPEGPVSNPDLFKMESYNATPGKTDFSFVFKVPVVEKSFAFQLEVDPTSPRVGPRDAFYWRRPLIPQADRCGVVTVAFPPTTVSSDDVILQMMSFSSGVLTFLVSWDTPLFLNGDLVHYELCIGENEMTEDDICSSPSQCFYIEPEDTSDEFPVIGCISLGNLISVDNPATNVSYHVVIGTEFLIMQIRAINDFSLTGNWSDSIVLLNTTQEPKLGPSTTQSSPTEVWVYVIVAVLCVIVAVIVILLTVCIYRHFCFHRRIKYEDTMAMQRIRGDYIPPSMIPVADEWEVSVEDIEIFYTEELGHGAFGRVYRGLLHSRELRDMVNSGGRRKRGSFGRRRSTRQSIQKSETVGSCLVAVKRLRDNIDGPDKANFLKEIDMMKKVSGSHHEHQKFVVNMLGCVTIQEPMMLVLEYATHGDLLNYLRDSRDGNNGASNKAAAPYLEPTGAYSHLPLRKEEEAEEEDKKLTGKDLLSFARQIAAGMEFLSSLNVVHRDLACRNILVCDNRFVKISDFGLSRSLLNQEAYVITTKGVLPIRWMAPEALFYRTFDTQSDVWSYGILLWELYTLGGYPYPTMSNRDILQMLTSGYRMDKPELCTDNVYDVMLKCWNTLGVGRPTFAELYVILDNMLSETTRHQSPYVQVLGTCYYDTLAPTVQVDSSETLNLEIAPSNVDIRQTNTTNATENIIMSASLPTGELGNGYLGVPAPSAQGSSQSSSPYVTRSPSQDGVSARRVSGPQTERLGVPLHLSRPRSWVGTSSAELGPRYVPTPLYPFTSPHSSISNLTEETMFGSSIVTLSPEHRRLSAQSRSVGSIPLLTSANIRTNTNTHL